jgi:hypothetical protein
MNGGSGWLARSLAGWLAMPLCWGAVAQVHVAGLEAEGLTAVPPREYRRRFLRRVAELLADADGADDGKPEGAAALPTGYGGGGGDGGSETDALLPNPAHCQTGAGE